MSFSPSTVEPIGSVAVLAEALWAQREASFAQLGEAFYTRLPAAPLPAPYVVGFSADAATSIGLAADIAFAPASPNSSAAIRRANGPPVRCHTHLSIRDISSASGRANSATAVR